MAYFAHTNRKVSTETGLGSIMLPTAGGYFGTSLSVIVLLHVESVKMKDSAII